MERNIVKMRSISEECLLSINELVELVQEENNSQINKWGITECTPAEWMLYLTEEVGELADAISEREYRNGSNSKVVKEAIQAATLALKIAEMYLE